MGDGAMVAFAPLDGGGGCGPQVFAPSAAFARYRRGHAAPRPARFGARDFRPDRDLAPRHSRRAGARPPDPSHAGQGSRGARPPAARVARGRVDDRRGGDAQGRQAGRTGSRARAAARRHGRAADARGDGARLRLDDPRADARLRARYPHRDAGGCRRAARARAATNSRAKSSSCSSPARKDTTARGTCSTTG